MMRSMFSGVSGLKTHQTKMDVIGNNIANVNTTSFKSDSINFSELLYQSRGYASAANTTTGRAGINPKQIGLGVQTAAINKTITAGGAAMTTGIGTDVKINGDAFFIVSPDGTNNYFTRDGSFYIDGAGNLATTQGGLNVMGWQVNEETGEIMQDTVSALRVMSAANLQYPPEATTKGYIDGILDRNDPDVSTETGKMMNFAFYDDLGYSYTARFGIKETANKGEYTVELRDILDSNGKSLKEVYDLNFLTDMVSFGSPGTVNTPAVLTQMVSGVRVLNGDAVPANIPTDYIYYDDQDDGTKQEANKIIFTKESPLAGVLSDYTSKRMPGIKYSVVEVDAGAIKQVTGTKSYDPTEKVLMQGSGTITYDDLLAKGVVQDKTNPLIYYKDAEFADDGTVINPGVTLYAADILDADGKVITGKEKTSTKKWAEALGIPYDDTATNPGLKNISVDRNGNAEIELLQEFTVDGKAPTTPGGTDGDPAVTYYGSSGVFGTVISREDAYALDTTKRDYSVEIMPDGQAWISSSQSYEGFVLKFDEKTGVFQSIGGNTNPTVMDFNLTATNRDGVQLDMGAFHDISIDWSNIVWYNNGGASTTTANAGEEKTGIGAGRRVGNMSGVSISNDGTIYATYDNGMNRLVGQIAVARFANAAGLEKAGDNLYTQTSNSGTFNGIGERIDKNGTDSLTTGVLEMSNVDLSNEFTHMITTQRGFQANSRIITVSDTLLEELINLKR